MGADKNYFRDSILQAVLRYAPQYNLFPSAVLSMSAEESGWGVSWLARNSNNWFGIKKGGRAWSGPTIQYKGATWRVYESPDHGVIDHCKFLQAGRYKDVIKADSPETAVWEADKAGYSGHTAGYYNKVISIMNRENYKQYDGLAPTGPLPESGIPPKKANPHWADIHFENLNNKGITIHSKLFDEDLLRGDAFIMTDVAKNKFHQK